MTVERVPEESDLAQCCADPGPGPAPAGVVADDGVPPHIAPPPPPPRPVGGGTRRAPPKPPSAANPRFAALAAGVLIGDKYRLVECLGEGGMATVWVAHNEALDIEVAIKFIRTDADGPRLAERLLHEARAAAKLCHPAIVRVFDFGKTRQGDPYIVMERLDGQDLGTLYRAQSRMTPVTVVRTLLPIAHALAVAHDKGIIHRDLKPENIFLTRAEDGQLQPKLLDFGVAKDASPAFIRITAAGTAVGSPAYMSPEQARGEDVDARSDVWSFTVVLYEALSGVLPFRDQSYNALLRKIIEHSPAPIADLAGGDAALWAIVEKGLAKHLDARWGSMRTVGAALARWLLDRDVHEDIAGASLVATWLTARQSWLDSDAVFERLNADPGPPSAAVTSHVAEPPPPPSHADGLVLSPHQVPRPSPDREEAPPAVQGAAATGDVPEEPRRTMSTVPGARALPAQAQERRHPMSRPVALAALALLTALGVAAVLYFALSQGTRGAPPSGPKPSPPTIAAP